MNFRNPLVRIFLFVATFAVGFLVMLTIRVAMAVNTTEPIPVALVPEKVVEKLAPITVKLQWGGFYAFKDAAGYKVFRLIDINPDVYHVVTYGEKFRHVPNITEVSFLIPESEHEAYRSIDILTIKPILLGRKSLSKSDLVAYANYLRNSGSTHHGLMTQIQRVIKFSRDAPLATKLSDDGGVLSFDEAGFD